MTEMIKRDIEALMARHMAAGDYRSFDEALADLRSAVMDEDLIARIHAAWLRNEVQKGDESGGEIPAEKVFADARRRITEKL